MNIPSYKKINIKSHDLTAISKQLLKVNFSTTPIILIISHLDKQDLAYENIKTSISQIDISTDIYPICVLTDITKIDTKLYIISDISQAPAFFNRKVKPLNVKENHILNKIILKQKNLNALRFSEYKSSIRNYTSSQRILKILVEENTYLTSLLSRLDKNE